MTLRSLGILRAKDVPPIEVDPRRGARSRGRPTASRASARSASSRPRRAVAAALHDPDGIWRSQLPMKPKQRRRQRGRRGLARWGPSRPAWSAATTTSTRPRPGDARPAGPPDHVPRDPRAGLVAPRRRARPRDARAGRPCSGPLEALMGGHDRDRRPPRVARPPSRAALTSSPTPAPRSGVRVVVRLRRDRPPRPRRRPAGPGRERAVPARAAAGAWSGSTPRSPAATTRSPPPPGSPRTSASASTSTSPRASSTATPAPAWPASPATTGCSCTASTSTATCPARSPTTPAPT